MSVSFCLDHAGLNIEEQKSFYPFVKIIEQNMKNKIGRGSEYLGWLDLPMRTDNDIEKLLEIAKKVRNKFDLMIVIGIGGSYLGTKSILEALGPTFSKHTNVEILFLGNDLSSEKILETMEYIEDREVCVNVVSKSGKTLEPAIAFRIVRQWIEKKYGKEEASNRIFVTTDGEKGTLKEFSSHEGYTTFTIPDDIGGRYSVFTPVGLFPLAVGGIDIVSLLEGAKDGFLHCEKFQEKSMAAQYAIVRNLLYSKGKKIELFVTYNPKMKSIGDWYIQLFGESEGKEGKGIFPSTLLFSTDLHSMGQWIQQGPRTIFETILHVKEKDTIFIPKEVVVDDGLGEYEGKSISEINESAFRGTLEAHVMGGVPNLIWEFSEKDAYHLGCFMYLLERACGISAYLLGVNPFDQPGVEAYKKNMLAVLNRTK